MREHGVNIDMALALSKAYRKHPDLLPVNADAKNRMAVMVVRLLSGFRSTLPPQELPDEEFILKADEISQILPLIWGQSVDMTCIKECLQVFYTIISSCGESAAYIYGV